MAIPIKLRAVWADAACAACFVSCQDINTKGSTPSSGFSVVVASVRYPGVGNKCVDNKCMVMVGGQHG